MANLEIAPLTLVIGPQASGKSVLSKLIYFCTSLISEYDRFAIEDKLSFDIFEKKVALLFTEWFPISAWGNKKFSIQFELGSFGMKINRVSKSEKVKISFCDDFKVFYKEIHEQYLSALKIMETQERKRAEISDFELTMRFRAIASSSLRKWLGKNIVERQLFVPAGRSFFTSVGKALVAFEHSGILDPITLEFGRRFSSIRERQFRRPVPDHLVSSPAGILFSEILGGRPKTEGGREFIQATDGRLIPLSALSSGQQELLPLALTIRALLPGPAVGSASGPVFSLPRYTIYIEEPEAHLFPHAQNRLVEVLASLVTRRRQNHLLLTTHSPYVLAKFNNLIKAGSLSSKTKNTQNRELAKILPESSWLQPKSVNAYAIIDGNLTNIMGSSGLIEADYLDDVSGDIAREFTQILEIGTKQ